MEETKEIKVGDVVKLKGGGPDMTVIAESSERPGQLICAWFDIHDVHMECYAPAAALRMA